MRFSTLAPEVRSENTFKAKYLAYGLIMQFFSLAVSRLIVDAASSGTISIDINKKVSSGTQCSVSVYLWLYTTCLDVSSILSP